MDFITGLQYFCFGSNYHAVDCEWNDWTVGACSATCGDGVRTNTRTEKVSAAYGGEECSGTASTQEMCNIQLCPRMISSFFLYNGDIFNQKYYLNSTESYLTMS